MNKCPLVLNEKGNITKAPETPPRTCFSEQDSSGSRAVTQRTLLPHSASYAVVDGSRSPLHETQFFAAIRELPSSIVAQLETAAATILKEPGDPALRLFTGNSFCFLPATGRPRDVTGLQQAGLWEHLWAFEELSVNDFSMFRPRAETSVSAKPLPAGWPERSTKGREMPCCRNCGNRVMIPQPRNPGTPCVERSAKSVKSKFARPPSEKSAVDSGDQSCPRTGAMRRDSCSEICLLSTEGEVLDSLPSNARGGFPPPG